MASKKPPSETGGTDGGGYQVLARKYRPRTFEDLVGQEPMVRTLTNAFKTGRIAHAFMLTGVRGVGKTTTARLLARALNYKSDDHDGPSIKLDPPGEHCAAIMASQHPDVMELDAASHTGVADMRDLLDGSRYAPVSARYKVYIIDEVHMLSNAAFNALLKTLEEPPPHVKFIFATTEVRKVPVTVLSRCQRFNLQRFTVEGLSAHLKTIAKLENAEVADDAIAMIARAAEGSARDGLSILDQVLVRGEGGEVGADTVREMLGLADRTRVLDLVEKAIAGQHKDALVEAEAMLEAGADAPVMVRDMMDVMVEVSRAQALTDAYSYAGPKDWMTRTQAMAEKLSPAQAARMWRLLLQGFEDCGRSPDPTSAAQVVVLRLAAAAALPPPEDAARMLAEMKSGGTGAPAAPRTRSREGETAGATAMAGGEDDDDHPGVVLDSLREVLDELERRREIDLTYEIERFVRPAEIRFGHFRYTAAAGAPAGLSGRIKTWLEGVCGVEWQVEQTDEAVRETAAELRRRKREEKLEAAKAHPRVQEALRLFPGARVISVDGGESDELDGLEELDGEWPDNVIRVEFGPREAYPDDGEPEEDSG